MESSYLIGIDLGTTHTALCYKKLNDPKTHTFLFQGKKLLPSKVGKITSPKSWLFASSHHKDEPLLPLEARSDEDRMTPSEAMRVHLAKICEHWNKKHPEDPLQEQKVVVGCPASFNERARTLTLAALKKVGFNDVRLIEEPLSAFYHWLAENESHPDENEEILVVDIGGGTTDFTLIRKLPDQKGYQRVAVGDHLLLGGDNMDLAIEAHFEVEDGKELKETLPADEKIFKFLVDGFFPYEPMEMAASKLKSSGFRKEGLPYPSEPSLIRHLAKFLISHDAKPTALLFNGGVFKAKIFKDVIHETLEKWYAHKIKILKFASLDLAVAKGGVTFLEATLGLRAKVEGGAAKSYYLQLETSRGAKFLSILPKGTVEGKVVTLKLPLTVKAGEPVDFPLFSSHTRHDDKLAEVYDRDEEGMSAESVLSASLKFGKSQEEIPVDLLVELTELGVIAVSLRSQKTSHQWLLEFSARSQDQAPQKEALFEESLLKEAEKDLILAFQDSDPKTLSDLMKKMENFFSLTREKFPASLLRSLWQGVKKVEKRAHASDYFAERWWYWAGFCLRPGWGYPLDEVRVSDFWKAYLSMPLKKGKDEGKLIALRRVAPGLSRGQQQLLIKQLLSRKDITLETRRLIGSLEKIPLGLKQELLEETFAKLLSNKGDKVDFWVAARLGARRLMCRDVTLTLPKELIEKFILQWLEKGEDSSLWLNLFCFWLRKSSVKAIDISKSLKDKVVKKMSLNEGVDRLQKVAYQEEEMTLLETDELLGEPLPLGLQLIASESTS